MINPIPLSIVGSVSLLCWTIMWHALLTCSEDLTVKWTLRVFMAALRWIGLVLLTIATLEALGVRR